MHWTEWSSYERIALSSWQSCEVVRLPSEDVLSYLYRLVPLLKEGTRVSWLCPGSSAGDWEYVVTGKECIR